MTHGHVPALPATLKITPLTPWTHAATVGLADATLKAYAADSATFGAWARAGGLATLPASPETVATFLEHQATAGKSVATIRRYAATLSKLHRAAQLANPCEHELVRMTLRGIARTLGTQQRQAHGLTQREADRICSRLGDRLKDVRDAALVLVGRDLLARSSELVALEVCDVTPATDGALVQMRRKKTSTEQVTYFIGSDAAAALATWLKQARITGGLVFRSVSKAGRASQRGLSPGDVGRILKAAATTGRLEHRASISGHSLRVGMTQNLVDSGAELASVMQAGGWSTPRMVARYSAKIAATRGAVAKYHAKR
jgi:site-specific recombinase XerD